LRDREVLFLTVFISGVSTITECARLLNTLTPTDYEQIKLAVCTIYLVTAIRLPTKTRHVTACVRT